MNCSSNQQRQWYALTLLLPLLLPQLAEPLCYQHCRPTTAHTPTLAAAAAAILAKCIDPIPKGINHRAGLLLLPLLHPLDTTAAAVVLLLLQPGKEVW